MHKKLEAELVSLAHRILQMKNKDDVFALRDKAQEVYERLSVLAFVDEYLLTTSIKESKEELLQKIENATGLIDKKELKKTQEIPSIAEEKSDDVKGQKVEKDPIFEPKFESVKIDIQSLKSNQISLKEEFKDAISADKTSTLFEDDDDVTGKEKKTLNDKLFKGKIQVGLNDRIAFVKHLFNNDQASYDNVLSQLNRMQTEKEAKDFIMSKVKLDHDWNGKEAYEERLIVLIERRFS